MTESTAPDIQEIPVKKPASFYIKRITGLILLLALAAVFSYSGFTKIGMGEGVDPFAWTFIDMGINSQLWAGVIARVMVGLEFLIAGLLVAHIFLRSLTYPLTITVLSIFSIYLVIQIILHGNTGNCGCFGEELQMTPLNGIWKNLAMIAATVALFYLYPVKPYKHQEWLSLILALAALVTPFLIDPINASLNPTPANKQVNLSPLYEKENKPSVDLRQGKHIVAFMSLTCPHCRKAAKRFAIVHENNPQIPIYFVLAGNPKNLKPFFDDTKSENIPHVMFRDPENFLKMAGSGVPAIFYLHNSTVEFEANYFQLDPQFMKDWLAR